MAAIRQMSTIMDNAESVYRAALLLVEHFKDCMEREGKGIHSRVFTHFLHPEKDFVAAGQSQSVIDGESIHPEHVVPCAVLISETCRLIKENMPKSKIAELLAKHWKVAYISKNQANYLDSKDGLNLKHRMPDGWKFETGDTFARLKLAKIDLLPIS